MSELLIDPSVSGRKNSAKSCICIVQLVDALGCSCRWPSNNCRAHLRDSDSIPGTTIRSPQIRKSEQISHSNGKYLQRQMNAKTRRRVAEMRKLQNKCAKKYFSGPRTIRGGGCCFSEHLPIISHASLCTFRTHCFGGWSQKQMRSRGAIEFDFWAEKSTGRSTLKTDLIAQWHEIRAINLIKME